MAFVAGFLIGGIFAFLMMAMFVAGRERPMYGGSLLAPPAIPLYRCDKKACGERCPNDFCDYTMNVRHAINFTQNEYYPEYYMEKDKEAE